VSDNDLTKADELRIKHNLEKVLSEKGIVEAADFETLQIDKTILQIPDESQIQ